MKKPEDPFEESDEEQTGQKKTSTHLFKRFEILGDKVKKIKISNTQPKILGSPAPVL